jgi:glycosyltransferase involved in cell wall biosynthesis
MSPFLTILTINYNNASGLQKTVESVLNQTSKEFEYIIVDGGSTDGSVDYLIAQNSELRTQNFSFISEKDKGIYNAMNKGIGMAKGEYIHFLNSGDWLVDAFVVENMLKELDGFISSGLQPDVFVGNKIMVRPDGKVRYGRNDKRPVTALTFYRGTIEHTSAYIRRAMFDVVGMYDESLRIVSDWKWYFDAVVNHNAQVVFTDIYVSYFDNTGISSTNQSLDKAERRQILEQILPPAVLADYDRYHFAIDQYERLRRYPFIYKSVYLIERILFKLDKWEMKYWGWKKK